MKNRMQFISLCIYSDTFCHSPFLDPGVNARVREIGRELMFTDAYSVPGTSLSKSSGFYSHLPIFIIKSEAAGTRSRNRKYQGILLLLENHLKK